jgi:transposase
MLPHLNQKQPCRGRSESEGQHELHRWVKSDKAGAFVLAEMLRTRWYSAVHVKSEDSHRLKTLLGARDQLVRAKRALGNQVRGVRGGAIVGHGAAA